MGGRKKGGRVFVGHRLKGFSLSQPREQMVVGTGWLHCVHDQEAEELNMWCSTRFLSFVSLSVQDPGPHDGVTTFRADLVPQLRFSGDFPTDTPRTVSPR